MFSSVISEEASLYTLLNFFSSLSMDHSHSDRHTDCYEILIFI